MAGYLFPDVNALVDAAVAVDKAWKLNRTTPLDRNFILATLRDSHDDLLIMLGQALSEGHLVADAHILQSAGRVLVKRGFPEAMADGWTEKIYPLLLRLAPLHSRSTRPWAELSRTEREQVAHEDWKWVRDQADQVTLPAMLAANDLPLIDGIEQTRGAIVADMLPNGEAVPGDKRADIEDARMLTRVARAGDFLAQAGVLAQARDIALVGCDKAAAVAGEAIGFCDAHCFTRADGAVRASSISMDETRKLVAASHVKRGSRTIHSNSSSRRSGAAWSSGRF